jgi:hypothetical protein
VITVEAGRVERFSGGHGGGGGGVGGRLSVQMSTSACIEVKKQVD